MVLQVATLRSAVKLEQEQQFLIAKKLQELTGSKNIKLKPVIDESLIAGFVVEYGSSQVGIRSHAGSLSTLLAGPLFFSYLYESRLAPCPVWQGCSFCQLWQVQKLHLT